MENAEFQTAVLKPVQTEAAISRQAQEVQAAMVIAKKFPRDENAAYSKIMKACGRKNLAEAAVYEYPRGATKVSGPSIRLAEVLAQSWGNLDFGIVELEQRDGESTVMAYAWDLETNTRQSKVFQVKHERSTKKGIQHLNDPRDIYEMVANQGARRVRACIMGVIPGDVIDDAVDECEKTMKKGEKEPISDRIRKMIAAFSSEFNVSQPMIEERMGHKVDAISETELVTLKKIYRSLKDGMSGIEDHFNKSTQADRAPAKFAEKTPKAKTISDALAEIQAPVSEEEIREYYKANNEVFHLDFVMENIASVVSKVLAWIDGGKKKKENLI